MKIITIKELVELLENHCVFDEICAALEVLPDYMIGRSGNGEITIEPPPLGDYGRACALVITPQGLFWETRKGRMETINEEYNSGEASPGLLCEILHQWVEYKTGVRSALERVLQILREIGNERKPQ